MLKVEGDEKIISTINELYTETRKDIPIPGNFELIDIPVDIFISGIHEPFISLPVTKSNVLYDDEKKPSILVLGSCILK